MLQTGFSSAVSEPLLLLSLFGAVLRISAPSGSPPYEQLHRLSRSLEVDSAQDNKENAVEDVEQQTLVKGHNAHRHGGYEHNVDRHFEVVNVDGKELPRINSANDVHQKVARQRSHSRSDNAERGVEQNQVQPDVGSSSDDTCDKGVRGLVLRLVDGAEEVVEALEHHRQHKERNVHICHFKFLAAEERHDYRAQNQQDTRRGDVHNSLHHAEHVGVELADLS